MQLKLLQQNDAGPLLQFETANRAWFEQFIETRGVWFYTPEGMRAHIADFMEKHAAGRLYPYLVLDEAGSIIGRVNLRDVECAAGTARLGYRVGTDYAGCGITSAAVLQVLDIARSQLGLKRIIAHVSVENPASARVLEKNGFTWTGIREAVALVQGREQQCHEYVCELGF
ncbi:GNAT family N-acetyltransferase [Undibacterium sp. TJN25]|uniref:GNAT family N-acetyltransferase n=1 Tax=Undibacterium sp. TJN25 TaxID=3413056 RepID=UPI003BF15A68